ncbi:hypothetical protein M436DRAFT_79816 [Aureobasidium namibiae CBS 147.97]|uniref:Uncharacterized protein n=1 Tax=Aureobasidium namibiae CBS 147.97 TaxID=1043004 RepID=A0A074WV23_9PEZI
MSLSSHNFNLSAASKPSPIEGNRLSLKEQDRLNEAAKVRVAKILGVTRNMIDLTDDEPPKKMARLENNSRTEFRHSNPPSHRPRLSDRPPIPGTAIQSDTQGLVIYQAPNQINNPYASPQTMQAQGFDPLAPNQHSAPYMSPQVVQTQGPNTMAPPSTDLAHPVDLLNNISLSVASLELFQLQQILSTAALRHPDVLEHLRTSFRIQETDRSTAHQALFDLLRVQSQGEIRVARLQDERSRKGFMYTASPYGPPSHEVAGAPAYAASSYGPSPPNASVPSHYPASVAIVPTQAHHPASSHADFPPQVVPTNRR